MNRILVAASAAAFATLATFGSSQAAVFTASVQTADLDMATAEGQARLESRIDRAVREVCGYDITGSRVLKIDEDCAAKTRASVEKQVSARRVPTRSGG